MEHLVIIPVAVLFFGGGFFIALIALLIATLRKSFVAQVWLSGVASLALLAQGACWNILPYGDADSIAALITFAGAIVLAWSVILITNAGNSGSAGPVEERKSDDPI